MIDEFYPSPSNFITRTIFGVIMFQDFAAPFLQNDTFDLQTGGPVLTNEKRPRAPRFPFLLSRVTPTWLEIVAFW